VRKILVLNNDLDFGGIQKSLITFLDFLDNSGNCEIDLMLWQKDGPLQKMLPKNTQIIFQNYGPSLAEVRKENNVVNQITLLFHYVKFIFYARVLKKPWLFYSKLNKHYDAVVSFTHNGYPRFFAVDRVSATDKYLWFHHGSYNASPTDKNTDRKYYEKFNKIITVSSSNKDMLAQHFPEFEDKLFVIPNIINSSTINALAAEPFQEMNKSSDSYNFVTVSRFSKEKGLDLAINIAFELKERGLKFRWFFVGDGDLFFSTKELAEQKKVGDVCVFVGSKENPYPYFKHADLYVQTSYVEAHPITLCEALILKKMIVTTDLPSTRELLQDGKLGVLCKPDAGVFAVEILKLLQSELRQNTLLATIEKHDISNEIAYSRISELLKI
jgi:glycosyltransferase involved in cell wall biosynthesis